MNSIEFSEGDLVYGLGKPRARFITQIKNMATYFTIDDFCFFQKKLKILWIMIEEKVY